MDIILLIVGPIVLLFGFVVLFGAPYVPVLRRQKVTALDMLDLKPGQTLLELGCGDGRVLRLAAERRIRSVGYEINPLLVLVAKIITWKYRHLSKVVWGNFWEKKWPEAAGIFVFLLPKYMNKLDTKITQECRKPVKLVSFAFEIPNKDSASAKEGVFLYEYR